MDAAVSKGKTDEVPRQGWGSRHRSSLQRNAATRSGGVTSRGRGETAEGGVLEMGDQGQGRREMRSDLWKNEGPVVSPKLRNNH